MPLSENRKYIKDGDFCEQKKYEALVQVVCNSAEEGKKQIKCGVKHIVKSTFQQNKRGSPGTEFGNPRVVLVEADAIMEGTHVESTSNASSSSGPKSGPPLILLNKDEDLAQYFREDSAHFLSTPRSDD